MNVSDIRLSLIVLNGIGGFFVPEFNISWTRGCHGMTDILAAKYATEYGMLFSVVCAASYVLNFWFNWCRFLGHHFKARSQ